ncbi:hypothetical protein D9M71_426900 [compost metagenome]
MHFPGDTGFFFFTHALQVGREFAQLLLGLCQRQLGPLALCDVPDYTVPHHLAVAQMPGASLDIGPALFALPGEDAPLPGPVLVAGQGQVLHLVIISTVLGVHQVAQAHLRVLDLAGCITHQCLATLTDIGELQIALGWVTFQAKHQPWYVASNALEPRLTFAKGRQGTVALSDIGEVDHQIFGITKAQKAQ